MTGPGCGSGIWQKEKNMATYRLKAPKAAPKKKGKKKNPKGKKK